MLHCICGFTCGTQGALDKHLARFADTDAASEHAVNTKPDFRLPVGAVGKDARHKTVGICGISPAEEPDSHKNSRRSFSCPEDFMRAGENASLSPANSSLSMSTSFASSSMMLSQVHPSSGSTTAPTTPVAPTSPVEKRSVLAVAGIAALGSTMGSTSPSAAAGDRGSRLRLLIVRHAQSANKQRQPGQKASADPDLTDLGYEQASALSQRLGREFGSEAKSPPLVVCSPMRRCLFTIQPTVQRLKLRKENCLCHGGAYEFGCTGKERRTSTPEDIAYDFPEFSATGFSASGQWDYRGGNVKETEQECRERLVRLAEWLQVEAKARCRANDSSTLILTIHQSVADLLTQILVEGTAENWSYGDIKFKLNNAAFTEVFLHADGSATMGSRNEDAHNMRLRASRQKTCSW